MSTAEKLFSFQGRMRRRDWWVLLLILIVVDLVLSSIGMAVLGGTMMPFTMGVRGGSFDLSDWMAKRTEVQIVISLITLWPMLAIGVKRLHDRGRSGWWFVLLCALSFAQQCLSFASSSRGLSMFAFRPTLALLIFGLATLIIGVWLLIEMGFLDGTPGSNRFGPSPKGLGEPAAAI